MPLFPFDHDHLVQVLGDTRLIFLQQLEVKIFLVFIFVNLLFILRK